MENELQHFGILGMHWGIRRYQPYPKGKRPAGAKEIGEAAKAANNQNVKENYRLSEDGFDKYGNKRFIVPDGEQYEFRIFPTKLGCAANDYRKNHTLVGATGKTYNELYGEYNDILNKEVNSRVKNFEVKIKKKIDESSSAFDPDSTDYDKTVVNAYWKAYTAAQGAVKKSFKKEFEKKYGSDNYEEYLKVDKRLRYKDSSKITTDADKRFLEDRIRKGLWKPSLVEQRWISHLENFEKEHPNLQNIPDEEYRKRYDEALGIKHFGSDAMSELTHHGILGMHWGIRRYQPYPKGKKPPGAKEVGEAARASSQSSNQQQSSNTSYRRSVSDLSDDELRSIVNRLNLEKQYAQLTASQKSKSRQFVEDVLLNSAKNVATKYTTQALTAGIDKAIAKMAAEAAKKAAK